MSVQKRKNKNGSTSFIARVRDESGNQHSRTFPNRKDAVTWEAREKLKLATGDWIDPRAGKITVGEWCDEWSRIGRIDLRESSRANDDTMVRVHIVPRWGQVPINSLTYLGLSRWVADLTEKYQPSTVVKILSTFRKILNVAVRARLISVNPVEGVPLPTIERRHPDVPTPNQVAKLILEIDPRYRPWCVTAAYSGLRFGELAGLRFGAG